MKALSVKNPWVELQALGLKPLEVRKKKTNYRGQLLLVSSLKPARPALKEWTPAILEARRARRWGRIEMQQLLAGDVDEQGEVILPGGVAVCIVDLVDCTRVIDHAYLIEARCHVEPGDWLWRLANPRRVEPVKIKGSLSFFNVDDSLIKEAA